MPDSNVPLVVVISDNVWHRRKDELIRIAPQLQAVVYEGNDELPADILPSVTAAFFSGDLWPERARGFMLSALKMPHLSWLHTFSAGIDNPVFTTFRERGVRVSTSTGASSSPIAQTVFMYMLSLSRDLPRYMKQQQEHVWQPHQFRELHGERLAVIGLGAIGQEIVRIGQAMNMDVIACRRSPSPSDPCSTYPLSSLHDVVSTADWVVVALPLTDDTRGMFDDSVFAAMKPGVGFINIGRGELIDEQALVASLQSKHIGCAGLDVFAEEPLPTDNPLWDMPNVIITPHASGQSDQSLIRAEDLFIANLERFCAGQQLINEADPLTQ